MRIGTSCLLTALVPVALLLLGGCGKDSGFTETFPVKPGGPAVQLTAVEVDEIVRRAAASLDNDTLVVCVVDREGRILALFRKPAAPVTVDALLAGRVVPVNANELALSLARTGAFFSSDQAPLSSRTVRFISREHFPPTFAGDGSVTGVGNTPSGALWNIEATNRGCALSTGPSPYNAGMEVAQPRSVDGSTTGLGIATVPGGVPLFKGGKLVGGIGVTGNVTPDVAEFAAFRGALGFEPIVAEPGEIFIDGVRLPFVEQTTQPAGTAPGTDAGAFQTIPNLTPPPATITAPQGGNRANVPEGLLIGPLGSPELTAAEVTTIIQNAVNTANETRAIIRLPLNARTRMVMAVTSLAGNVLGLFRMEDATVFSIDVAVTKARNVSYLSSAARLPADLPGVPLGTAITNRTLRFGSQPFFPPGISGTTSGPFVPLFNFHLDDPAGPCSGGLPPGAPPNPSGIVFFPGSAPLYKGGFTLVGGLGVSGDGVDQDDVVTAGGIAGFEADESIRADQVYIDGVKLPYIKFPRAPDE